MSYVRIDDRRRIMETREESGDGWTWVADDMRDWNILDGGVPLYKLSEDNWVLKRTDAEIKKDKRFPLGTN